MLHLSQLNSAGGRAHRLSGYFTVLAILLTLMAPSALAQVQHSGNPYANATGYLDSYFGQEVANAAAAESDPVIQGQMYTVANQPTALWLTQMSSIPVLQQNVEAAYAQSQTSSQPIVMTIVVYDLPQRDCAALASSGEISISPTSTQPLSGIETYERNFITPIYSILARYKTSANLRFVLIIEPDSLPNLVTNVGHNKDGSLMAPNCVAANDNVIAESPNSVPAPNSVYVQGIQYALNKLHPLPNVYLYLDIGQSAWLGWPGNMQAGVALYTTVVKNTTAGFNSIDGFITNTANYVPTKEPYLTATKTVDGGEVYQSGYYQYNPYIDEVDYVYAIYPKLVNAGFFDLMGFLIDTSRDGWGGPNRPTGPSTSTDFTTFVDQSKIDQRPVRGVWCNIANAGIGALPKVYPLGTLQIAAFVWIKKPGESDGTYPGSVYDTDYQSGGDPNCNPNNTNASAGGPTDAIPNSPPAGIFWPSEFEQLVQNAYPPLATTAPSLKLYADSSSLLVTQGATVIDNIYASLGGYTGTVSFGVQTLGLTSGSISATFEPSVVTAPGVSLMWLTASADAAPGTYVVTVTGYGSGGASSSVNITLIVHGARFTLTPAQTALTILTGSGAIASDAITVTGVGGFDGNVTLSAAGLPPCVTASFSPSITPEVYFTNPQVSTLTFTANTTDACTGTYTVMVTGVSGGLTTLSPITLTTAQAHSLPVPGFTLSASPASLLVAQNSSGAETVTATPTGGFSGPISSFSASGFPYGVTIGNSGGGPLGITYTFAASSAATPGTYTVTVTATSGSLTKTATFQLTVTSFSVSATPPILTVAQGGKGVEGITVTPTNGFSGTISSFNVSGLPSGVTIANSSGGPLGITYTFAASSAATPGTSTITITATSGSLSKTATFQLTVTPTASAFGCHVVYTNSWQAGGGFGAAISIQNTGSAAINSWKLTWAFPSGQIITSMWDQGTYTQSGANVTVTNASYDGTIAAGATFTGLGFNGTLNGTANAAPTSFAVNGTTCK